MVTGPDFGEWEGQVLFVLDPFVAIINPWLSGMRSFHYALPM